MGEYGNSSKDHKCARSLALCLCAISMVGSIAMIGLGIRSLVEMSFVSAIIGSHLLTFAASLTLLVGVFSFTLTPLGLYSVIINRSTMMVTYSAIILVVASMSATAAYMGYRLRAQVVDGSVSQSMKMGLYHEYGHPEGAYVDDAWDRMQIQFTCCGINSTNTGDEWIGSKWFRSQKHYPHERLPRSCCATCSTIHEKFCVSFFVDTPEQGEMTLAQKICLRASDVCTAADSQLADEDICLGRRVAPKGFPRAAFVHAQGCEEPLFESISYYSYQFIIFGLSYGAVLFVSAFTWFALYETTEPSLDYHNLIKLQK